MRLIFVLLIMLNVAYAAREMLFQSSDVPGVAVVEAGRRPTSAKLLMLGSEASATGDGGSVDLGAASAYEEPGRDDAQMALRSQALATLLRLPYIEADGPRTRGDLDRVPLTSLIVERAVDEAVQPSARRCIRAGPFADGALAERTLLGLQGYTSDGVVRREELDGRPVFWVHVPPSPTRADARMVVRSLSKRGIASFVIADEGPFWNGVSLGVYHDAESANRFAREMSNIGFPVKVFRSRRTRTVYYVHASIKDGVAAGLPVALVEFVKQSESSAVLVEAPCSNVAVE